MLVTKLADRSVEVSFQHEHWDQAKVVHHLPTTEYYPIVGYTLCYLTLVSPSGDRQTFKHFAACSAGDIFSKEAGRKIALTRALKASGLDRLDRGRVWDRYFSRHISNKEWNTPDPIWVTVAKMLEAVF